MFKKGQFVYVQLDLESPMKPGMRHRPARSSISNPGLRIASAPCLDPVCKKCIELVSLSSIHDDEGDCNGDSPTTVSNDLSLSDNAINVLRIRAVHGENFPPMVENLVWEAKIKQTRGSGNVPSYDICLFVA